MATHEHDIKCVIGLGNPGAQYANTRHNAGVWLVQHLAALFNFKLKVQTKCSASIASGSIHGKKCILAIPSTYMNESGRSVQAICSYYKLLPREILIAHDELDIEPGSMKLKIGGGHAGHNGLRDIHQKLSDNQYARLRVGIGHPGRSSDVSNFVLSAPNRSDKADILSSIDFACHHIDLILQGEFEKFMQQVHS